MSKKDNKDEIQKDKNSTTVALSTSETVSRYGSANAEYIKGYTGVDNETGQKFAKSLKGISEGKINPDYAKQNTKQQAGYSAEVVTVTHDNAEAIIKKSPIRASRSDDLPQFGRNHNIIDRVKILNGEIIEGSQSQMKFVGDLEGLLKSINEDTDKGVSKFSRYRGIKLELPSEQCNETYFRQKAAELRAKAAKTESAKEASKLLEQADAYDQMKGAPDLCLYKAKQLRAQADKAESKGAPPDVVKRLRDNADNYEKQAQAIVDSGLTTEDAIFYRKYPKLATARDIAYTSHRAGIEGAKIGSVVGGTISILKNVFAVAQEKKQLGEAAKDVALDTGKAAVAGYGTVFVGSAVKGAMQQSGNTYALALSRTNAPALAVQVVLSLGSSVKRYVSGEIDDTQLLEEVGEKGAGMLSASMMAALGQLVIPVPFVGAAIGSMVGYTLSSMFYQAALEAGREAKAAKANLVRVQAIEAEARAEIEKQRNALAEFMAKEMPELLRETEQLFAAIDHVQDADAFAAAINSYAELMGAQLQFKNQMEFDDFMLNSNEPLRL